MVAEYSRNRSSRQARVSRVAFLAILVAICANLCAEPAGATRPIARKFSLPSSGSVVWEAEQAVPAPLNAPLAPLPQWQVIRDPRASANAYVEPQQMAKEHVLEFPFQVDRDVILQVYPLWWLHGERKPAQERAVEDPGAQHRIRF